jgi:hypothetical protein
VKVAEVIKIMGINGGKIVEPSMDQKHDFMLSVAILLYTTDGESFGGPISALEWIMNEVDRMGCGWCQQYHQIQVDSQINKESTKLNIELRV